MGKGAFIISDNQQLAFTFRPALCFLRQNGKKHRRKKSPFTVYCCLDRKQKTVNLFFYLCGYEFFNSVDYFHAGCIGYRLYFIGSLCRKFYDGSYSCHSSRLPECSYKTTFDFILFTSCSFHFRIVSHCD